MADIPLLDHIVTIAEREIADILEAAETEANRIFEAARSQAERMVTNIREQVRAEADRIRERRINTIRFTHNARIYDRKSRALAELWREAEVEVAAIEQSDRYPVLLEAFFAEGAKLVPDGAKVHAAAADIQTVRKLVEESGKSYEVLEDSAVHGGIAFHWPDDGTVLINTLGYRLARLRAEGNAEISRLLFAGDGEVEQ